MSKENGTGGVTPARAKRVPWPLALIFLFLAAAVTVSGYFYHSHQKKSVLLEQTAQLQAFADLKAIEIRNWLEERMGDAQVIAENAMITGELLAFLRDRSNGPRQQVIQAWMESLRNNYHYQNILLVDAAGNVILSQNDLYPVIGKVGLELMAAARRREKAILSDLHLSAKVAHIHLDIVVPLLADHSLAGFVFLRIDPVDFLYPMIQSWPTPSPSAETLLVRREGNDVLFLNELRHRKNTALKLREPLSRKELPAVQAVLKNYRDFSGRDYRGTAVWSVSRPIEGTTWSIVAKIDREEIEQPVRRSALWMSMIVLSLILAAAMMILFLWQRQSIRFHLQQFEAEKEKQALVKHFDYLSRYANDLILLSDKEHNIVEANERAVQSYGFSRKELLAMNIKALRVPDQQTFLEKQYRAAKEQDGIIFETVHQRRDGTTFPVEVSARIIRIDDKEYFQSIYRDISDRKGAEKALRESEAFVRSVLDNLPIGVAVNSIDPSVTFSYMNDRFPEIYRTTREKLADPDSFWSAVYEDPAFRKALRKRVLDDCASGDMKRMVWEDIRVTRQGGEPFYISARNVPVPARSMMISLVWDVSERKRAEDALRENEEKFKQVFETANVGKSITQLSGEINVNQAFCAMLGYDREALQSKRWQDLTPADDIAAIEKIVEPLLRGRENSARFTKRYVHKNGSIIWGDVSVAIRRDANGRPLHFITTVVDITERKKVEEALQQALAHIRQIIDANIIGVVIADSTGRIIECNDYYLGLIGYSRAEFEQGLINWRALTPPEWLPADEKAISELRARGTCTPYEKEYLLRDGTRVPVYLADALLYGAEEQIVAFAIDLSERKQAEAALRLSEKRLRETQEMAHLGHWSWNIKTGAVEWSEEVFRIFQLDRERFTPQIESILALSPWPEDRRRDEELIRRATADHKQGEYEQRFLRPDGSIGHYHSTFQGLYDAQGGLHTIIGTVLDISERKQAEDSLRQSEARLRAILDATPFPIAIVDIQDDKIHFWSRSALALFGHTAPTTTEWYELAYPDPTYRREVVERWKPLLEEAQRSGQTVNTGEYRVTCRDGSVRICELHAAFLADRLIVTFNDITDRRQAEERLKETLMLIRTAGELAKIGGWNVNLEENRSYWSDEVAAIHEMPAGYSPLVEEGIGFYAPEWREKITKVFSDCAQKGIPYKEEMEIITAHGKRVWIQTIGEAIRNDKGIIYKVQGAFQDISERKRTETAIVMNTQRVQTLLKLNQMTDASLKEITDFALEEAVRLTRSTIGYLAFLNEDESALTMHSWSRSAMAECAIIEKPIVYPVATTGLWGEAVRQRQAVITNDYAAASPLKKGCPEGHVAMKRHMNTPVFAGSRIVMVAGVGNKTEDYDQDDVQQLTLLMEGMWRLIERRQSEDALRESERKFRETVINLDEGYYSVTLDGKLLEHNQAFNRILGFDSRKDLKGTHMPDFWQNPEDRLEYVRVLAATGAVSNYQINAKTQQGENITVLACAHMVKDESGTPLRIEGIFMDISQRIRAEQEIQHLNEELEQRVLQRTALLEAANKELEAFSYSVSHDLRAPLRAIDGFSRIVLEEYATKLDSEGRRLLGVITGNTKKMGCLIDDLLAFSRLSRQQMSFAAVDLAGLADAVFSELKDQEKGRIIEFKIAAVPIGHGDHSLLRQLLQNLMANAVKFTRTRKVARIEFNGRAEMTENVYFVKDNGVGFDRAYADKLFGVFQRLHSADEFEGTGVGLAIVQRIVQRHGGRVWAESKDGKGAVFYFSLPNDKGLGSRG